MTSNSGGAIRKGKRSRGGEGGGQGGSPRGEAERGLGQLRLRTGTGEQPEAGLSWPARCRACDRDPQ